MSAGHRCRLAGLVLPTTSKYLMDNVVRQGQWDLLPKLAMAAAGVAVVFLAPTPMPVGDPSQMVARGVDMFDCVLPTRIARNGTAFTETGTLNLKNAEFAMDEGPIEEGCRCYACRNFARGYLRHLAHGNRQCGVLKDLVRLERSVLALHGIASVGDPPLDVSQQIGESSHFAARMNDAVVVLARINGLDAFQLSDRAGIVRPAYCTALVKVILASLRQDQLDRHFERVELKPLAEKTVTDATRLRRDIEDVHHPGIALDDGEFDNEARCAAMPVRDFSGQVVGATGISGPVWRLSIQALQSHARSLGAAADRLSEAPAIAASALKITGAASTLHRNAQLDLPTFVWGTAPTSTMPERSTISPGKPSASAWITRK